MQDFSAGDGCDIIPHEVGMSLCDVLDNRQNSFPKVGMPVADFIEQGVGFCFGHRDGEAGLCGFGIVFHLDGDENFLKLIHGGSLSNHIFIGLAEHGQGQGVGGGTVLGLDVLHGGTVGQVGGGDDSGGDEGEGGEDFQNRFHGGGSFLCKMGIKIAPLFVEKDAFGWYNLVVNIL